ncbi:MAG: DEAD/DEAH box helicase [Acidimicrobiia bacterium]|nr:DEAD/DEAH box helicase [Acidimicrobiia bacterium]
MKATEYLASLPFEADRFQREAAEAVDRGESVVVAAPTGSGKTAVAEAAIAAVVSSGKRAVYTTPIKALSNQKFSELRLRYGHDSVGLLTGDNSINGSASVVVMTTEVLRNMMYADSPDLAGLGVVVLDEVHYLQDRARGAVWEEIIIHLDQHIPLICLSATVPNAEEFSDWVAGRRGPTTLVVERERPVPLDSTYLLKDAWDGNRLQLLNVFEGDVPNPVLLRMLKRHPGRKRYGPPRRFETAEFLAREGLLPAIYFIFSRAGCSDAANRVVDFGLRLTSATEAAHIRESAFAMTAHLDPADLAVLGYGRWVSDLAAGVAPHHAGLVPAFKEATELLFSEGMVKLVFATETLALGINMPARSVVLESLSKFTGEGHETLTPGAYTQLTGRAGRRGIDTQGTAVVLHSGYVSVQEVAGIAGPGGHPLRSSFRPTYNMAVNLIASYGRDEAEHLLNSSFAQHRDALRSENLEAHITEGVARLATLRAEATCDRGDVGTLVDDDRTGRRAFVAMERLATACSTGDVLAWSDRGKEQRFVVVARGSGKRPRLLLVSSDARLVRIGPDRIPEAAAILGQISLDTPFRPRDAAYRHRLVRRLDGWEPTGPPVRPHLLDNDPGGVAGCPDLQQHLGAARAARKLETRIARDRRRLESVSAGMVPRFRAILSLLGGWGYVDDWRLTAAGEWLRVIYNELDLLLTDSISSGHLNGLDFAELAAIASAFTYESRSREEETGVWPTGATAEAADRIWDTWERLVAAEGRLGVPKTRSPEAGFAEIAYRWASGESLEGLFEDDAFQVGDFVRNCRQLIDLLRQIGDGSPDLAATARQAVGAIDRGVVAAVGIS